MKMSITATKGKILKPYNIKCIGEKDAEINLYGEIVDDRPTDWWTGEPIEGNFIVVREFLKDLEELADKENITVHINSVGGSLYGGIAIYNRLKSLSANITTINDGLAASAGSIIFQAGSTRKVNAGSSLMIHGALGFLYGYYQVPDLEGAIKQLEAGNKAAVNIYAETTGNDKDSIKTMLDNETWFTGQEAVEGGFADEVIGSDTDVSMSLTADKKFLLVNGVCMQTYGLSNIPKNIPVLSQNIAMGNVGKLPADNINNTGGETEMEIKNIEELRSAYPDFVAQIEAAAYAKGAAAEKNRIKGIEEIQNAVADAGLINLAKYGENPLTAEQLAFKSMQAQAKLGNQMLTAIRNDAEASGTNEVTAAPNSGKEQTAEEKAKADEQTVVNLIVGNRGKKEGK